MPQIEAILNKITQCITRASSLGHHLRATHHLITDNRRPEEFRKGLPIMTKGGPPADNTRRISSMETEARPRAETGQTRRIIRGGHPIKQIRVTPLITGMLECLHGLTTPMLTVLSILHRLEMNLFNCFYRTHVQRHSICQIWSKYWSIYHAIDFVHCIYLLELLPSLYRVCVCLQELYMIFTEQCSSPITV